jgi:hypothetical protein
MLGTRNSHNILENIVEEGNTGDKPVNGIMILN